MSTILPNNKVIEAKVVKIYKTFVLLETFKQQMCRLNLKQVSDYFIGDLEDIFRTGDIVDVLIIDYDENKKTYMVSFKQIHPRFLRNPFNFDFDEKNDFKKLLSFSKKELKNGRED